ncbi:two-component system, response regulator YesN [Cohnella sp. OV330]|uniref:response regulator n=1 Tax=Cohnella sp. OV330 TaxID=1855288 RepID=UPI0008E71F0A|nr:response regulator [Cohnella sp. OV330]SFB58144.1 two-component system, response regulator YesN [Cohnella sp. OV330]
MTKKPIGVVIVDDEYPIREELRAFPWEACDAVLIGEAENGEEALALCEKYSPDIVVTDITMPIMDGLTFIRELRKNHPVTQIILLTCHSDFEYARRAIALGASDYILKVSLDEEELKRALRKAGETLLRDRGHFGREIMLRRLKAARRLETRLKDHRAETGRGRAPAPGDISDDDWALLGFAEDRLPLRFVLLRLTAPEDELLIAQDAVQESLLEYERRTPTCKAWFPLRGGEYAVWFSEAEEPEEVRLRLERLLGALLAEAESGETPLIEEQGIALSATVGGLARSRADVWALLEAASWWREAGFYDAAPSPSIKIGSPKPLSELEPAHRRHLSGLFGQAGMNADRLLRTMQGDVAPWCAERRFRPAAIKRWLAGWTSEWLSRSRPGHPDPQIELSGASDWGELETRWAGLVRTAPEAGPRREIVEARSWIQAHLQEPLSLPIVAQRIGLGPEYFGRLFKEETGESVHQLVLRLRMEKALKLLRETDMKVYEVAEAVGIPNYRYFTSTFRNWAGAAPTDVKRLGYQAERSGDGRENRT